MKIAFFALFSFFFHFYHSPFVFFLCYYFFFIFAAMYFVPMKWESINHPQPHSKRRKLYSKSVLFCEEENVFSDVIGILYTNYEEYILVWHCPLCNFVQSKNKEFLSELAFIGWIYEEIVLIVHELFCFNIVHIQYGFFSSSELAFISWIFEVIMLIVMN